MAGVAAAAVVVAAAEASLTDFFFRLQAFQKCHYCITDLKLSYTRAVLNFILKNSSRGML